ncbi:MAG: molybdopterin-dependent oxidoreductase, partial [Pseudobdellovibrionaceae bacterium]|nr:molybdopterin-dependent oxidoreductase [Pseudobdellovibrionaceae bacterium]
MMVKIDSNLNRREFMAKALVVGGVLTMQFNLPACATTGSQDSLADGVAPNAWIRVSKKDGVIFILDRVEMGQGVISTFPFLIAEELHVLPENIKIEFAPADDAYINKDYRLQITGGSNSLKSSFLPLREAASSTRLLLEAAAARHWNIKAEEVETKAGVIHNRKTSDSKPLPFFADLAKGMSVPKPRLTPPDKFVYIGRSQSRPDNDAKVHGKAEFGIDVKIEGMRTAILIRPPYFGGRVESFDATKVLSSDVEKAVATPHGLALVGRSYWSLREASKSIVIRWSQSEHSKFSSEEFKKQLHKSLENDDGKTFGSKGSVEKNFAKARKKVDLTFEMPYLAHATMEPQNCTVHLTKDSCHIWAPTQSPELAKRAGMRISGLKPENVFVHTTFLGGGFGRRLTQDYVEEALEIAKATDLPIKLIWSREDDMGHDFYRPLTVHRVQASLDDRNEIGSWHHKTAGQSILAQMVTDWLPAMSPNCLSERFTAGISKAAGNLIDSISYDQMMIEGASPIEYRTSAEKLVFQAFKAPVLVGSWRSVGHSYTAFVVESVIDQLAHEAGEDPVAFRKRLLSEQKRHLGVLTLAAEKSSWGNKVAPI